ncbi:DEAD/DEAH box helicase domain-containing protein [Ditylenchus destructor]|nr:DEAD/DEAH box helicase domain-containing protein [Ditylenchus destructor]
MNADAKNQNETPIEQLDESIDKEIEGGAQAIPPALGGADLMVSSRTGSGKTASFILPALQQVLSARADRAAGNKTKTIGPRVLVLAPTRELAMQVAKSAMTYGRHIQGLRVATVLGGMPYAHQLRALSGPLDILIATPGRLLDHINSGRCKLENVTMFVIDEADRMLDMGFIDDINFVAQQIPASRQTLMYSATFAGNTGRLASQLMKDPQRIDVSGHTESHENIEQRLHWADNGMHKRKLLETSWASVTTVRSATSAARVAAKAATLAVASSSAVAASMPASTVPPKANDRYGPRTERPAFKGNDNRFERPEGRPAKPAFSKGPRGEGGDRGDDRGGFVKKGPRKGF